jgi:hypothetical protein
MLEDEQPGRHRSRAPMWVAIVALFAGLMGVGWYGISRLDDQQGALKAMNLWKGNLDALGDRVTEAERQLTAIPDTVADLAQRVTGFEKRLAAVHSSARKETQLAIGAVRRELRESSDAQAKNLQARISELEAARQQDLTRTAELERTVGGLNRRQGVLTSDTAANREAAMAEARQIRHDLQTTDERLTQVASFNNRPRERFEVRKGADEQIGPNILLHVSKVDPRYRQFDGWIQLVDEGKFLWLKKQDVLHSFGFYAGTRRLRHDLVVTALSPGGVAGYLILPSVGESAPMQNTASSASGGFTGSQQ